MDQIRDPNPKDATSDARDLAPADEGGQDVARSVAALVELQYSGPLPPPAMLAKFEEIQAGLVERIIGMAERQAAHRQVVELKQADAIIDDQKAARAEARIGQVFGFLIGIVAILAGTYAAVNGSQWSGVVIGGGGVVALVSVFVMGKRIESAERDKASAAEENKGSPRTEAGSEENPRAGK